MSGSVFSLRQWRHVLVTGFGAGLAPKAPGTVGTLVALPFILAFTFMPHWLSALCLVALSWWGAVLCQQVGEQLNIDDHGSIVIDEIAGFAIAMWAVPLSLSDWQDSLWLLVIGFALFRWLDIWKPWPIRWFDQHVAGGWGVMLDDIVAGLIVCAFFHMVWL